MGCCAIRQRQPHQEKGMITKEEKETSVDSVISDQTAKEEVPLQASSKQLGEFISKLREVYSFSSEKHYWFDSTCLPQSKETFTFQTNNYTIQCQISEINLERLSTFKFALIAPQWQQQKHTPPFFIYCIQERPTSSQLFPVLVKIQKNKICLQQQKLQFTANLNNILKLVLHVQLKITTH